jgi:NAD(P)-dependent dehydrogenase (short-subunit alcohol dehydrogenase family)
MSPINPADEKQESGGRRVALVTGATGAIGKAIARQIAAEPGYAVTLVARNERKAQQAQQEIIRATGNPEVRYELVDLARRAEVHALAARWQGPLHVLVNNAAATPHRRQETPEGIEVQFATNVLGYFWMTRAFLEILQNSAPARVVNVASYYAGDLDLDDLEFRRRVYDNRRAYRQSKQANRMLSAAFAGRLAADGIAVNACHPGDVNSKVSNDLGFGGHESPDRGAETPVWLATTPVGQQNSGKYYEHRQESRCRFSADKGAVERLYEICSSYDR